MPPVCRLSDWHSLAGGCLAVASELPSLATLADRFPPLAALGLGAMHQEGERAITEAVAVVVVNLQPQGDGVVVSHDDFTITRERTLVDQIIELATIRCGDIEVFRQVAITKLGEDVKRFAIAIELQIGVHLCNLHPRLQILKREEVARLVNTNQLGVACLKVLQCNVNLLGSVINTSLQVVYNRLQVVCSVVERSVVLHLRRCSETTKLGVLGVLNRTLAVCINNSKGLAEHSTWAGTTSGQVEDQGLGAQLSVALGEGESHGLGWWWGAVLPPDGISMAPPGGLWAVWWTVCRLAHPQKSTTQSGSFLTATQKKLRPLLERRNTRFSLICSTIHSGLLFIKLANLFFAFLLLGETNARSNITERRYRGC